MNKLIITIGASLLVFSLAGCQNAEAPSITEQPKTQSIQPASSSEVDATQKQPGEALKVELKTTQEVKKKSLPEALAPTTKNPVQKDKTTAPAEALKGITIKADGFAPSNITIAPGTKVIFINMDDNLHWPASGVHPTHQICPGFDALKGLAKNETYTFTFTEAKTCPFHDHLNPSMKGTITVK